MRGKQNEPDLRPAETEHTHGGTWHFSTTESAGSQLGSSVSAITAEHLLRLTHTQCEAQVVRFSVLRNKKKHFSRLFETFLKAIHIFKART